MIWPDLRWSDRLFANVLLHCESSALVFEHLTVTDRLCFHMSVISNRLHTYTHAHTHTLTALLVPVCQRKCVDVYRALKIKRNRGLVPYPPRTRYLCLTEDNKTHVGNYWAPEKKTM